MLIADERQEFASVIGRKTKAGRLNAKHENNTTLPLFRVPAVVDVLVIRSFLITDFFCVGSLGF